MLLKADSIVTKLGGIFDLVFPMFHHIGKLLFSLEQLSCSNSCYNLRRDLCEEYRMNNNVYVHGKEF